MHVLPVARVLALKRLPTYEEIKHELVEQRDGMHTVFVSQTWLTRTHPDTAENVKLTLLQSFLRDASAGKKGVKPSLLRDLLGRKAKNPGPGAPQDRIRMARRIFHTSGGHGKTGRGDRFDPKLR